MTTPTVTFDLLVRIRNGDHSAFTPLFEQYRGRLAAFIRYRMSTRLRETEDFEDLLQDTFLRAYRELDRFTYRGPGSFLRWLTSIAGHVVVDAARYHGREKRAADRIPLRSESRPEGIEPADTLTPSRLLGRRETLERLFRNLDRLPEQYREVILLSKIEGLSTHEIAERLGTSRENAALLLHRALARFRRSAETEGSR